MFFALELPPLLQKKSHFPLFIFAIFKQHRIHPSSHVLINYFLFLSNSRPGFPLSLFSTFHNCTIIFLYVSHSFNITTIACLTSFLIVFFFSTTCSSCFPSANSLYASQLHHHYFSLLNLPYFKHHHIHPSSLRPYSIVFFSPATPGPVSSCHFSLPSTIASFFIHLLILLTSLHLSFFVRPTS